MGIIKYRATNQIYMQLESDKQSILQASVQILNRHEKALLVLLNIRYKGVYAESGRQDDIKHLTIAA